MTLTGQSMPTYWPRQMHLTHRHMQKDRVEIMQTEPSIKANNATKPKHLMMYMLQDIAHITARLFQIQM